MAASKAPLQVKCPQCGTQVKWNQNSPFRPFCSKRCRLIDLGEWASEGHRIPGEPAMDETDIDALIARMERGDQQQ